MLRRRPPGEGGQVGPHRKIAYAALVLFLFNQWLPIVDAQQQQQQAAQPQALSSGVPVPGLGDGSGRSSLEYDGVEKQRDRVNGPESPIERPADAVRNLAATRLPHNAEGINNPSRVGRKSTVPTDTWGQPPAQVDADTDKYADSRRYSDSKKKKTNINENNVPDDASALATLAPEYSVRAPPLSRPRLISSASGGAGLATPQTARSLEDWEVEDFVLLATVDGNLYATDRKTGAVIWTVEHERPMVDVVHHRANVSSLDDDYSPIEHYIWAIEPSNDGELYLWVPGPGEAGLVKTDLTMKKLVESAPYESPTEPKLVYAGERKTSVLTLDAATGKVLKWFGSTDSHVMRNECRSPNAIVDGDSDECTSRGIITLGRVEYTVGIYHSGGQKLATLQYAEWTPNSFDNDLHQQYRRTLDNRYITCQHDGKLYGFDYEGHEAPSPVFTAKFSSPVAKVFDVMRPNQWQSSAGGDDNSGLELILLPEPALPTDDSKVAQIRSNTIFLNQTETGSWYALSGKSYPLIVEAPHARASGPEMHDLHEVWENLDEQQMAKALVGMHHLSGSMHGSRGAAQPQLTLPDRPASHNQRRFPSDDVTGVDDNDNDSTSLPVAPVEQELPLFHRVRSLPQQTVQTTFQLLTDPIVIVFLVISLFMNQNRLKRWYQGQMRRWRKFMPEEASESNSYGGTVPPADKAEGEKKAAKEVEKAEAKAKSRSLSGEDGQPVSQESGSEATPPPDSVAGTDGADGAPEGKKKAHRGRRGGVKHRKGKKGDQSQSANDEPDPESVEETLDNVRKLVDPSRKVEPDIQTVSGDNMQDVSLSRVKVGNLEVDTNRELGIGSNGTIVYAGTFDGRDVAVKRMLLQFYDIASQETKLLRESDDHPNVIRYFAQYQADPFLYIALELCQCTLSDVIERPSTYKELAAAGAKDLPSVLYQITSGIRHLHDLRIVHRDLKPQNILVNLTKEGKPRLVVSDFGLCKKLDGEQSSFRATTAHAAGTAGWRAPELLLDDDARERANSVGNGGVMADVSSTHSSNGSNQLLGGVGGVDPDGNALPGGRRATKAIDIFSLGLVFFYVLTKGSHPFGDRYMREVNIRKGAHDLGPLDVLGDYAAEARDLITAMLSPDPRQRPAARAVLSHPFFWSAKKRLAFLCDVSDYFEKEPRDPPSPALAELERHATDVITNGGATAGPPDFLKSLPREFIDSLGRQRKYTGNRLLDLLRALRNKKNHYEDMHESLQRTVGSLPEGYLGFWTRRFPDLLLSCWIVVYNIGWETEDRFREYYEPQAL